MNTSIAKDRTRLRVVVEPLKTLIQPTAWDKKQLASVKVDLVGLCEFGCSYCSSSGNNWHRVNRAAHAEAVRSQTGTDATPYTHPFLSYHFPDPVGQLRAELTGRRSLGEGKTLAFGCLVDNFSPSLVTSGVTRECLELLLERTSYRIRITTKNAVVGNDEWIEFFRRHPGRIVVNLSIGTLDDEWARAVEIGTSQPSARVRAMHRLQDAGIPTGGMLCPIFPGALDQLDALLDAIRPERCEMVWAEPYNDRTNWAQVTGHAETEAELRRMFGPDRAKDAWSEYAVTLYQRLRRRAEADGWLAKLAYMLYEDSMSAHYARTFADLRGVLLQSIDRAGRSKHPLFAELQDRLARRADDPPNADPEAEELARWEMLMAGGTR